MGRPELSSNREQRLLTDSQEELGEIARLDIQGSELIFSMARAALNGEDPLEHLRTDEELNEDERRRFAEAVTWTAGFFDLGIAEAVFVAAGTFHSAAKAKALSLGKARSTDEAG